MFSESLIKILIYLSLILAVFQCSAQVTISPAGDHIVCDSTGITLHAESGFDTYVWQNGFKGQNIYAAVSGAYYYIATVNGVTSYSDTSYIGIVYKPDPTIHIHGRITIPYVINMELAVAIGNGYSYDWNNGTSTINFIHVNSRGKYKVVVTNAFGCSASDSLRITPFHVIYPMHPAPIPSPIVDYYQDLDADIYGNIFVRIKTSSGQPAGYVQDSSDCNDGNSAIHPNATEVCNGVDDNCDGNIDEGFPLFTYYADVDNDGFGDPSDSVRACVTPTGFVADSSDCNDTDGGIYPGATETCNGLDDNCDGLIDEGFSLTTWFADIDGDTYGNPASSVSACAQPPGYVVNNTDCNDGNSSIHPGASETCNGIDDNCNGSIDEGVKSTFYQDTDGDGYGNLSMTTQACAAPSGYVADSTDCNDANAAISPGEDEICGNSIDDNCNGSTDEGCTSGSWNSHIFLPNVPDNMITLAIDKPNYAYNPTIDTNKLLIFLPGSNAQPSGSQYWMRNAAVQGCHVLGIYYPNKLDDSLAGLMSNDDYVQKYMKEMLFGTDLTPLITIDSHNCIEGRILSSLQYLNATYPTEGWAQFYDINGIIYSKLIISGHSQGGNYAATLGLYKLVLRVIMASSPRLACVTHWNTFGGFATSLSNYYYFWHINDTFSYGANCTNETQIAASMGVNDVPVDVETDPINTWARTLETFYSCTGSCSPHKITINDSQTPIIGGIPVFTYIWNYLLGV